MLTLQYKITSAISQILFKKKKTNANGKNDLEVSKIKRRWFNLQFFDFVIVQK